MSRQYLFTSESVSDGHPDKLADRISDTILDAFLERDPFARVACETFITGGLVLVAGEFATRPASLVDELRDFTPDLVRRVLRDTGYDGSFPGIDSERCEIRVDFDAQSPDIDCGVSRENGGLGAGDQGLMFGYAVDETPERMLLPITLAHRLMERQAELRHSGELPWLRPDAKSQVTVRYGDDRPLGVGTVVLSTQHAPGIPYADIRTGVIEQIIEPVVGAELRLPGIRYLVNPTGRFEVGGPLGDSGLTGRKIIVDIYGGSCPHGGGAFSGKDPTKVDRSGTYMARHIAKNVLAAGLGRKCTVQLAYAIGVAEPVSVHVDLHGTGIVREEALEEVLSRIFELTPGRIIESLDLRTPMYAASAAYGHFGRELPGFTWERTDQAAALRQLFDGAVPASEQQID